MVVNSYVVQRDSPLLERFFQLPIPLYFTSILKFFYFNTILIFFDVLIKFLIIYLT
jgi:hypothetical protein